MTETGLTPDAELLRKIAGGDPEAAALLRHRHSTSLYALAYAILMDPVDADLVVEGTFAQITQQAAEFDPANTSTYAVLSDLARTYARALADIGRPDRGEQVRKQIWSAA